MLASVWPELSRMEAHLAQIRSFAVEHTLCWSSDDATRRHAANEDRHKRNISSLRRLSNKVIFMA